MRMGAVTGPPRCRRRLRRLGRDPVTGSRAATGCQQAQAPPPRSTAPRRQGDRRHAPGTPSRRSLPTRRAAPRRVQRSNAPRRRHPFGGAQSRRPHRAHPMAVASRGRCVVAGDHVDVGVGVERQPQEGKRRRPLHTVDTGTVGKQRTRLHRPIAGGCLVDVLLHPGADAQVDVGHHVIQRANERPAGFHAGLPVLGHVVVEQPVAGVEQVRGERRFAPAQAVEHGQHGVGFMGLRVARGRPAVRRQHGHRGAAVRDGAGGGGGWQNGGRGAGHITPRWGWARGRGNRGRRTRRGAR